jgi:hypothetical protein
MNFIRYRHLPSMHQKIWCEPSCVIPCGTIRLSHHPHVLISVVVEGIYI